jgi:hypothetical protein
MVNTIVDVTALQGPAGSLVVKVKVTLPAAISAAEGVYVAVKSDVLLKVPDPEVDHKAEVAPPPMVPANV